MKHLEGVVFLCIFESYEKDSLDAQVVAPGTACDGGGPEFCSGSYNEGSC